MFELQTVVSCHVGAWNGNPVHKPFTLLLGSSRVCSFVLPADACFKLRSLLQRDRSDYGMKEV